MNSFFSSLIAVASTFEEKVKPFPVITNFSVTLVAGIAIVLLTAPSTNAGSCIVQPLEYYYIETCSDCFKE